MNVSTRKFLKLTLCLTCLCLFGCGAGGGIHKPPKPIAKIPAIALAGAIAVATDDTILFFSGDSDGELVKSIPPYSSTSLVGSVFGHGNLSCSQRTGDIAIGSKIYSKDGDLIKDIGDIDSYFGGISYICYNPEGRMYLSRDGFLNYIDNIDSLPVKTDVPGNHLLFISKNGTIYTSDWYTRYIDVYPKGGAHQRIFLDNTGNLDTPRSTMLNIAADSKGNMYTFGLNRLAKYAPDGTFLWDDSVGEGGAGRGMTVDYQDRLYVAAPGGLLIYQQ